MTNWKKVLMSSAALFIFLAGCSNDVDETDESESSEEGDFEGATDDPNELTVWTWDPNFNVRAMEIAEEYYQEDNPDFSLNIVENSQSDIVQRLNITLSSGVETGLPNIVFIEDYRAPSFLNSFPDSFYPLEEYYDTSEFADYKIQAGSKDDNVYNVPFDTGVAGLFVRIDYLEEAGYSSEDLNNITWDEYVEIGQDVYDQTNVNWLSYDHGDQNLFRMILQSTGTWFTEDDGVTPYIENNEALRYAFEIYKELYDSGIMNIHNQPDQLIQAANNGDVVTIPMGNWFSSSITQEESQSGLWEVVSLPRVSTIDGAVNASNVGGSSIYVLNIEGKELAGEFLGATYGSNTDIYEDLVLEIQGLGTYEPAAESEAYELEHEFFNNQRVFQDFANWVQEIPEVNFGEQTYAIGDFVAVALQEYIDGAELDDALSNAQQQAESSLN